MTTEPVTHFAEHYRAPEDYLYLLVDGLADCALDHPLSVPSLSRSLGNAAITRVLRPDLSHTPEACPALIQLAKPGESPALHYLELSADYSSRDLGYHKRYICGWLLSPQPLDVIAAHIAARCHTTSPGDEQCSAWFEPLRLELLLGSMGTAVGDLLNPIRIWLCPTSWKGYILVHGTTYPIDPVLPLSARDTQRMAPVVSEFLDAWRHTLQLPLGFAPWRWKGASILPPQAGVHAFRLVHDAHRLGLDNSRDIIALCLHRVFIHPHLPQHPDIQQLIAQARAGAVDLQSHFASHYSEAKWKRVTADLPHAKDYS